MLCGNGGATVCAVADSKCLHFISTVSGYFRGAKLPPSWQPRGLRAWARLAPAVPGPSVRASVKTAGHSDARPQTFRGARLRRVTAVWRSCSAPGPMGRGRAVDLRPHRARLCSAEMDGDGGWCRLGDEGQHRATALLAVTRDVRRGGVFPAIVETRSGRSFGTFCGFRTSLSH